MKKYFDIIKESPLFTGISNDGLEKLLSCFPAGERHYERNQFIFTAGDRVSSMGIVLSGGVHIIQEDFWGNRTILAGVGEGGLFGEALSCAEIASMPVSVIAAQSCDILMLDYRKITSLCSSMCDFHLGLIKNMLRILAQKNVMLTQKMEVLSRRTTREKLLAYLSAQAQMSGSNRFEIPFNRQELAEYLSVDRSAMSGELGRMRDEGILLFDRSRFELL